MLQFHVQVQATFRSIEFGAVSVGAVILLFNLISTTPKVFFSTTLVSLERILSLIRLMMLILNFLALLGNQGVMPD